MKKIILFAALLVGIVATATTPPYEVNEKILKAFNQTFGKVQDVVWNEFDNICQANFKQDDIQVRAQYDREGTLIQTIRYYGEKQLLPNIVARLKKKYANREIFGVTETSSDEGINFLVTLKDEKN